MNATLEKDIAPCGMSGAVLPWEQYASYCTTGQFSSLDKGFVRHCGPTAIVNLLLTFERRHPLQKGRRPVPSRVFKRVAMIGKKSHYYWNMDVLKLFGGTFNIATASFIRRAFAYYGRDDIRVHLGRPALPILMKRALDRDAILYLETVLHPKYGNHHMLAYGYREMTSHESGKKELYLVIADGWSDAPRYLRAKELRAGWFLPVSSLLL